MVAMLEKIVRFYNPGSDLDMLKSQYDLNIQFIFKEIALYTGKALLRGGPVGSSVGIAIAGLQGLNIKDGAVIGGALGVVADYGFTYLKSFIYVGTHLK